MLHAKPDRSASSIVDFCRFVRGSGLPACTQQSLAARQAVNLMAIAGGSEFRFVLRAALCSSQQEWELFDLLYKEFWDAVPGDKERARDEARRNRNPAMRGRADFRLLVSANAGDASLLEGEGRMVSGASAQQRLKKVDFSEAMPADLAALEQLSLRLLRRMSLRLSRRRKISQLGDFVDLRRSIRRNVTRGGDPMVLAYKERKREKKRLVIFLDISGSMNLYSVFLVRFAYALQKRFKRVDTFLFSTSVVEVSDLLRAGKLCDALRGISEIAPEWSGGTKIGGSLHEFNQRYAHGVLSRNTLFVVLSDGWDTGEPEALATQLGSIRRRVRKLLWLNPLLGLKDYQPITRGMSAALPYIDVFAPAHNLESLLALERYL